jgi:hypothetical protein
MELYEKRRLLIGREFPDYQQLRAPYDGTDPERRAKIAAYKAFVDDLEQMSPKELDELCIGAISQQKLEQEEAAERFDRMAYFNDPEAEADFDFWSKSKTWTIDEATALLLGKEPSKVCWDNLLQLRCESIFATQYQKLRNQLLRTQRDGRLTDGDVPAKFIEWAIEVQIDLPAGLNGMLSSPEKPESSLAGKERTTALQLIIGMAMTKYNYRPGIRSAIPKQIAQDLERLGLQTTDDTVRKFLNNAHELVDLSRIEK